MLDKRDFAPIGYKRYNKTTGKEVPWNDIVKGYEYEKDQFVVMSEEDFRREWRIHGDFVRKMPGVSAYRQNVVVVREREKGKPCDYDTLPIDGIVELWFKDEQTLQDAFGSAAGQTTMAHAKTFLGDITAFLVAERRVV